METIQGFYFDTVNTITADCDSGLLYKSMEQCARYDALLSKTVRGSDVWRLNHAEGRHVSVSDDTLTILHAAAEIYRLSDGAFNVSIGTLMTLWDFKAACPRVPPREEIEQALALCSMQEMEISDGSVRIPAGMCIDLGGIAKGYIADRVAQELREQGVESALLNFGGNIVAFGAKPDGSPWRIGLQSPGGVWGKDYWAVTELQNGTIVTSGVYERGFDLNGHRYHHILDPRTGMPAESGVVSVSLCGADSMRADALSTAALVLGPEEGLRLAQAAGYAAVCITRDNTVLRTPDFSLST